MVGWILDIIVLAVFVLLIIKGYKNGLVRSLVVIVGNIVALFLAFYIGKYLAGVIYDMSVRNAIVGYVSGAVNGAATADVSALLPGIFNAMPDYLSSVVINTYGSETELIAQIQQQLASGGTSIAITVADNIVRPVFVMLAQALIGLIVFIILSILVGFASRLFKGVNRIPVLGKANEILGGVVGVGQAVIYITLLAVAMSFFVALTSNTNEFINTRVIDQTFIFKHFYNLQILEISVAKI